MCIRDSSYYQFDLIGYWIYLPFHQSLQSSLLPQDLGRDAGNGLVLLPADDDDEHHYEQGGTKADGAQVEMEVEGGEG